MRNFVRSLWININLLERSEVLVYVLVLFIFTLLLVIFGQSQKSRLFEGGGFYRAQLIKGKSIKKYDDQKELMDGLRGFDLGLGKSKSQALKSEALKSEALKSEALKSEALKSEALKSEALKSEALKSEALKSQALKSEALKSEAIVKGEMKKGGGLSINGLDRLDRNEEDRNGVKWMIYTVRRGDFLVKIGNRFQVSLGVILKHNKRIRDPNLIYRGQKIRIPIDWEDEGRGEIKIKRNKEEKVGIK